MSVLLFHRTNQIMMMQTIGKKMIFRVDYDVSDEKKKQKAFFVLTISN